MRRREFIAGLVAAGLPAPVAFAEVNIKTIGILLGGNSNDPIWQFTLRRSWNSFGLLVGLKAELYVSNNGGHLAILLLCAKVLKNWKLLLRAPFSRSQLPPL